MSILFEAEGGRLTMEVIAAGWECPSQRRRRDAWRDLDVFCQLLADDLRSWLGQMDEVVSRYRPETETSSWIVACRKGKECNAHLASRVVDDRRESKRPMSIAR